MTSYIILRKHGFFYYPKDKPSQYLTEHLAGDSACALDALERMKMLASAHGWEIIIDGENE